MRKYKEINGWKEWCEDGRGGVAHWVVLQLFSTVGFLETTLGCVVMVHLFGF